MQRKKFSVTIFASKEQVWEVLWSVESFQQYTRPFCEGSRMETNWEEDSEARFLDPQGRGTLAIIRKNDPPNLILIETLGVVVDGVVDTSSKMAEEWKGVIEQYSLTGEDSNVKLLVETDIPNVMKDTDFVKEWVEALGIVKQLSEVKSQVS